MLKLNISLAHASCRVRRNFIRINKEVLDYSHARRGYVSLLIRSLLRILLDAKGRTAVIPRYDRAYSAKTAFEVQRVGASENAKHL